MANLALLNNNPGNLTVNSPNQILYPGQTGTYSSSNGLTFATFPNGETGFAALVDYVQRKINSGVSTVGGILQLFGAPAAANHDNPNPGSYTANFVAATGLQPSSSDAGQAEQIAVGIATAEGGKSLIPLAVRLRALRQLTGSGALSEPPTVLGPASKVSYPEALTLGNGQTRRLRALEPGQVGGPSPRMVLRPPQVAPPKAKGFWTNLRPIFRAGSKTPKVSASILPSPPSALSSSQSASPLSPSVVAAGPDLSSHYTPKPALPIPGAAKSEAHFMSAVSKWIEAHTTFLNEFLPAFKAIVDEVPLPPALKTAFDNAYSKAPIVITLGAAAVQSLGGGEQVAAADVAGAFSGGAAVVTVAPTAVPVAQVPAPPIPAPQVLVPPTVPAAVAPPATLVNLTAAANAPAPNVVAADPANTPITRASATGVFNPPTAEQVAALGQAPNAIVEQSELAALAASLGLSLRDAMGNVIPPGS